MAGSGDSGKHLTINPLSSSIGSPPGTGVSVETVRTGRILEEFGKNGSN
jgi:hypothetical protein